MGLADDYIRAGGYPETVIALKEGLDFRSVLNEILYNLEEDFKRKEDYRPELFRIALNSVANHIGSYSKLTQFGTTKYYAEKIITAMKEWHIFLEVEQHSFDPNRSHFLPKRYLHDLGIVNLRRSLAVPQISILETIDPVLRTPLGGVFENFVLLSLVQGESAGYTVGGWKKGNNTEIEVDFIFDLIEENKKIPVECKASVNVKHKHFRNLLHYLDLSHQNFGILISAAPFQKITVEEKVIINVPVYLANKDNFTTYYKKFGR